MKFGPTVALKIARAYSYRTYFPDWNISGIPKFENLRETVEKIVFIDPGQNTAPAISYFVSWPTTHVSAQANVYTSEKSKKKHTHQHID